MDPSINPYSPGAGTAPPELAGRKPLLDTAETALVRLKNGRPSRGLTLYGLRGVGKTVLLRRMGAIGLRHGLHCLFMEAPESASLAATILPPLRTALLQIDPQKKRQDRVARALRAVAGFVRTFKVRVHDLEVTIDADPLAGLADSGNLAADLADLLVAAGEAAQDHQTAIVFLIDELQYVSADDLKLLLGALHQVTQRSLPLTLLSAGLPQLLAQLARAKSYAERMFEYHQVGPLDAAAAREALAVPAGSQGAAFTDEALHHIVGQTHGYPYFLQEWGKQAWNAAPRSPIALEDAQRAGELALAALDASFFLTRYDRCTPAERQYLRAMAELGPGPHRSGDIARVLGKTTAKVSRLRDDLIGKGMLYSPAHGDTAFTVPLFDGFMKRIMPQLER